MYSDDGNLVLSQVKVIDKAGEGLDLTDFHIR
jgi:hypothetical protein